MTSIIVKDHHTTPSFGASALIWISGETGESRLNRSAFRPQNPHSRRPHANPRHPHVDRWNVDIDLRHNRDRDARTQNPPTDLRLSDDSWKTSLAWRHADCLLLTVANDRQGNVAFLLAIDHARDIAGRVDCFTVDGRDHVACFHTRFRCRTVFSNGSDERAFAARDTEIVGELLVELHRADADAAAVAEKE